MTTPGVHIDSHSLDEAHAHRLDAADPIARFRERFEFPRDEHGNPLLYLCGNSLGLMPKAARTIVEQELDDWARLAVDAHFDAAHPWYSYHEMFRDLGARLVGAKPGEVVMMNSLTVNLHLMMVTFYQPTATRYKILVDYPTFPSDLYALNTHARARGVQVDDAVMVLHSRDGSHVITIEQIEDTLKREGDSIALILMSGVNFFTGQVFDMARITELGHKHGCVVGFDLAHTAGNIDVQLHDWDVDFAAWCSYKYLNSGPGAAAGCFVHQRHGNNTNLPRFAGWWGNDPDTRFRMHLEAQFKARRGADGWQISNPPILSMAPLKASLDIFDEAGMTALRGKSVQLTSYLRQLLETWADGTFEIITPREPQQHGCQLSILVHQNAKERLSDLKNAGIVCDFREPNVLRVAPTPLYNSFHDAWRFARVFSGRGDG